MSATDRGSTFWVIDGIKIKKKEPYSINYIPRKLNRSVKKSDSPHEDHHQAEMPIGQFFFASASLENLIDRRLDYGHIHSSSLNDLPGSDLFGMGCNQDSRRQVQWFNSPIEPKKLLFANKFTLFSYESPGSDPEEDHLLF